MEHADGSEWTPMELREAYHSYEAWFALSEAGHLGVLFRPDVEYQWTLGDVVAYDWDSPAVNAPDMVVVWDE